MSPQNKASFWYCDQCQRNLDHGEYRYNCTECPNFDFCEQCMATEGSMHPHPMIKEPCYGPGEPRECLRLDIATTIRAAIAIYWDRFCMGIRDVDKNDSSVYLNSYSWLTYQTVGDRAKNFSHGLRQLVEQRSYIAICAHNRPEWMITDFACIFQGFISIPIYYSFTDREIIHVINNTSIELIVCDKKIIDRFLKFQHQCPSIKHIICMDMISDELKSNLNLLTNEIESCFKIIDNNIVVFLVTSKISIHFMGDIEHMGTMKRYDYMNYEPNDDLTIIYTSGSTGSPKGAILNEKVFRSIFPSVQTVSSVERVAFSYRPLAWMSDRETIISIVIQGGRVAFFTGDHSRLMEEISLVRPTFLGTTPLIWNQIYTDFKAAYALNTAHLPPELHAAEKQRLLRKFSTLIPRRCRNISIGGAMVSPALLSFLNLCFKHCTIFESYGISECGSVTLDNVLESDHEYSLESVPELGYTVDDLPNARGELLIKTRQLFSGYINNPEETAAAFTKDGFFRTGDIVEVRKNEITNQTTFYVIDRKKNFFKLSQGQFVSPEYLQTIYLQSPFVDQIYIHGDLTSSTVKAVIVPNQDYAEKNFEKNYQQSILFNWNDPSKEYLDLVRQDLCRLANQEQLRSHEIPREIIIDCQRFTLENGLLTSSMKLCRAKLAQYYGKRFATTDSVESILERIFNSMHSQNHVPSSVEINSRPLVNMNNDSLSGICLSRRIENELGMAIPLSVLFDPNMNLSRLKEMIRNPQIVSQYLLKLQTRLLDDAHLDPSIKIIDTCSTHDHYNLKTVTHVFLTGITGFIGCFLLAELISFYPSQTKFVCLVRSKSVSDGMKRIKQAMDFYRLWNEDYEQRIIPVSGDLSLKYFGLDAGVFSDLAKTIQVIFHCAARVNSILPYNQLYPNNVFGTQEIIRLATSNVSFAIPIHYLSSMSVLDGSSMDGEISVDTISHESLTTGYAQSKWVAEKLIQQLSNAGHPVMIYRLGRIGPHRENGACNPVDLYTLLLIVIIRLKSYPKKIQNDCRLCLFPIDLTTKLLVYLSQNTSNLFNNHIYHIIDPTMEFEISAIVDILKHRGIDLEAVEMDRWKEKVDDFCRENAQFDSVKDFLSNAEFYDQWKHGSNTKFARVLEKIGTTSNKTKILSHWIEFVCSNLVQNQ